MEEEVERRKVFNATLVLNRRAVVTATAIDEQGSRVFLGLEEGMLEEYSLTVDETVATASLTARKPIMAKLPILSILPATSAYCLAVLTGDAALRFVHSDTLESKEVTRGPVLAAAVTQPPGRLPLIVVATRTAMGRTVRLAVHEIVPAGGRVPSWRPAWEVDIPSAPGPLCLAWAGLSVVVGIGAQYSIAWGAGGGGKGAWRELLAVDEGDTGGGTAAVSLPRQGCALILAGSVGVVVNAAGEPVGNPLPLEGMPAVRAVAVGSGVAVLVSEDGMRVADPAIGRWIQAVGYGPGLLPVPGQPLRAAGGGTAASPTVLVAGRHKVWALTPVPPAEQAKDLLSRRHYAAAEALAEEGARLGQAWAEAAFAQAAILLLHEARFAEAVAALERCTCAAFQPAELFPVFPEHTRPWEPHPEPLHWSLAPPLEPIEELVVRAPGGGGGGGGAGLEAAVREGKQAVVQYLFRARELPGVEALDGVDTLLLHLLIDLGAAAEAAAFAAVPHHVRAAEVAPRLQEAGWIHALATLWAVAGEAEPALAIWRELADAGPGQGAAERERGEAVAGAAALLRDAAACPADLALDYLPWLLAASPAQAAGVLEAREDLAPSAVLPLLPPGGEARWRYLSHLVAAPLPDDQAPDPVLHTELARALIAAALAALSGDGSTGVARRPTAPLPAGPPSAPVSVAALVSGGRPQRPEAAASPAEALRFRLRTHLETSPAADFEAILADIEGTALLEEAIIAQWRLGHHAQALRLLALTLRDVGAAVTYTAAFLPAEEHRTLLHLLLRPGEGGGNEEESGPRWEDACRAAALLGASLDPLEVVAAAPEGMPMPAAVDLVAPLLRERLHRRRSGQVAAALQRGRVAAGAAALAQARARRVVIDEGRACPDCHLRLGGKVFVVLQEEESEASRGGSGSGSGGGVAVGSRSSKEPAAPAEPKVLCLSCWNKRSGGRQAVAAGDAGA